MKMDSDQQRNNGNIQPCKSDGTSEEVRGKEEKCIGSKLPIGVDGAAWGMYHRPR